MSTTLELELAESGAKFTPLGLILPESLDMSQWSHIGQKITRSHQAVEWWIGDWAAYGERRYGKLREFAEANGINYQTLRNAAWVSKAIEPSRRRDNLELSFHSEVAALKPAEQNRWLDRVETEKMSRAELRKELRTDKGETNALASEGKSLELPSQHYDRLYACLKKKPAEFWTPEVKEIWDDRFNALMRLIPA